MQRIVSHSLFLFALTLFSLQTLAFNAELDSIYSIKNLNSKTNKNCAYIGDTFFEVSFPDEDAIASYSEFKVIAKYNKNKEVVVGQFAFNPMIKHYPIEFDAEGCVKQVSIEFI